MIINKSPFLHNHSQIKESEKVEVSTTKTETNKIIENSSDKFSFWKWFKGLVNPLQNLPLISGIYSSVNSEDENSDRDLVQNSLGGFLYGGPIGAIAGFGNWVFNKLFDKTPTELALDATGVSNLWKENSQEPNKPSKLTQATQENRIVNNNKRLHIQFTNSSDLRNKDKAEKVLKQKIVKFENRDNNFVVKDTKTLGQSVKTNNENLAIKETKAEITKLSKKDSFREINFDYPIWKPEETKVLSKKGLSSAKEKYLDLWKEGKSPTNYNIDA